MTDECLRSAGRYMKIAIMQPYFLPYIGYFQLIAAVDLFVVYDNIKYTKKGWINRNRMLRNGADAMFSLPLKAAPDTSTCGDREMAPDFDPQKLLNPITGAYRRAPHFYEVLPVARARSCGTRSAICSASSTTPIWRSAITCHHDADPGHPRTSPRTTD